MLLSTINHVIYLLVNQFDMEGLVRASPAVFLRECSVFSDQQNASGI